MPLVRFQDLRGHRSQIAALARVACSGEPGHAYLFEGPEGVGKQTVAQAFLARLACTGADPDDPEACGNCRSCLALLRADSPDLARLARDGSYIKIDQVRSALGRLRFDPLVGRVKGLLVEDADTLREEAANALLKTLEEPPSRTVFVLVTSKPQLLLETIRSRCQALRFAELAPDDLAALLQNEGQPTDTARIAAALAEGSMTQARNLCDPQRVAVVDFIAAFAFSLGAAPATDAAAFVEVLAAHFARLKAAPGDDDEAEPEPATRGRVEFGRPELQWSLDVLRALLRDVVLAGAGLDPRTLPSARHAEAVAAMAARCPPERVVTVLDLCERLEDRLALNPNARLALSALLADAGGKLRGG